MALPRVRHSLSPRSRRKLERVLMSETEDAKQTATEVLQEFTTKLLTPGGTFTPSAIPPIKSIHIDVLNSSGGSIALGEAIYVTGKTGSRYTIAKARANADGTMPAAAVLEQTLADTATGRALQVGILGGLDTSAWSVGDELWISTATAGLLTNVLPSVRAQAVGVVIVDHATLGEILVNVDSDFSQVIDAHINDGTGAHLATAIEFTPTGDLSSTNVQAALAELDSEKASQAFVDSAIQGLSWKQAVLVATTANITLSGTQTIDGIGVLAGARVLVKDQTLPEENGIYIVSAGAWTRALDANTIDELVSAVVSASIGTVGADLSWRSLADATDVLGTDPIVWTDFGTSGPPSGAAGGVLSGSYPNPGFAVDMATQAELDAHVNDTTDAHDASAISSVPAGTLASTDVQAALNELDSDATADAAALAAHLADTSDAHDASAISTVPAGNLSSSDVQSALDELDAEKITLAQAQALFQSFQWKQPVRLATTAAGTLATSFENGDTVDGVVLATGDRILIKDQAAPAENGIYTVNASGVPTRATDFDLAAEIPGAAVLVREGTANADTGWVNTNDAPPTIGSTAINFTQFPGLGALIAGLGLTRTGNTLDVGAGTGIVVNANDVTLGSHDHDNATAGHGGILTNDAHDGYSEYAQSSDPSTPAAGLSRFWLDDEAGTFSIWKQILDSGHVIMHGYEVYVSVANLSGGTLNRGDIVRATAAASSGVEVTKAQANSGANLGGPVGIIISSSIADHALGMAMVRGVFPYDLNTNAITQGQPVYVSSATAGAFSAGPVTPSSTDIPHIIGICVLKSTTIGRLYVNFPGYGVVRHHHTSNAGGGGGPLGGSLVDTYMEFADPSTPSASATTGNNRLYSSQRGAGGYPRWFAIDSGSRIQPIDESISFVARNTSGGTLAQLCPVGHAAGDIDSGVDRYPTISAADADLNGQIMGILPLAMTNNSYGRVVSFGMIENVDTSAWTVGANLFVSQTAGALTATIPAPPAFQLPAARVHVSHATKGKLWVYPPYPRNGSVSDTTIMTGAEIGVAKLADGDALALLRTASDGVTVEWASAGQIVFPATQNPSADPNTFDDYEEGTWTFDYQGTTTPGTPSYTDRTAKYTKWARMVCLEYNANSSNKTGMVGSLVAAGVPFVGTTLFGQGSGVGEFAGITFSGANAMIQHEQRSDTKMYFIECGPAGAGFINVSQVSAGGTRQAGSVTYS